MFPLAAVEDRVTAGSPRVAVVMPVHNGMPFLPAAVRSVQADLQREDICIIVDDGSSDGSRAFIGEVASEDARVSVISHRAPQGVSAAMNAGIAVALGRNAEFLAVAEHDDVILPGRLTRQVEVLRADTALAVVGSRGRYLSEDGRTFGTVAVGPASREEFEALKMRAAPILVPHMVAMFRLDALRQSGGYSVEADSAQDLELINRLVYEHGWAAQCLNDVHVHYRLHAGATSFSRFRRQRAITRYVKYRNTRQTLGEPWESLREFSDRRVDVRTRLTWWRHDKGALLLRRAGLALGEGRSAASIALLFLAVIHHPRWVVGKAIHQVRTRDE